MSTEKDQPPAVAEPVDEDPRKQRALPPPSGDQSEAKECDHIPRGEGYGDVKDPHTSGIAADMLRGRVDEVNLAEIDAEWVLRRLVKEATDFGTRTRQSSRVKALELIGTYHGMWDPDSGPDESEKDRQRVRDLPRQDRLARIEQLMKQAGIHKAKAH